MNPQVIEYYESLFKFEIMQELYAAKPLKELFEQYVVHNAAHEAVDFSGICECYERINWIKFMLATSFLEVAFFNERIH